MINNNELTPEMIDEFVKNLCEAEAAARKEECKFLDAMSEEFHKAMDLCENDKQRKACYLGFSRAIREIL